MDLIVRSNYMRSTMLRRLLTCLALITGLAAAGAPVSAIAVEAQGQRTESSVCLAESGKELRCDCIERTDRQNAGKKGSQACKPRKPIVIYLPPLYLGIDRAHE